MKNVEFSSKNKFEKLGHLFGFIKRIYHYARSSECQVCKFIFTSIFYNRHVDASIIMLRTNLLSRFLSQ